MIVLEVLCDIAGRASNKDILLFAAFKLAVDPFAIVGCSPFLSPAPNPASLFLFPALVRVRAHIALRIIRPLRHAS